MRLWSRRAWAVVIAVTGISVSCAAAAARPPVVIPGGVRFTLVHARAASVAVAGDFNQWSTSAHPMARAGSASGVWSVVVPLPPGEHAFMFIVDGREWVTPPLAEDFVDDGFGARNGVVVVRPSDR